mmetsp:Transcript_125302/g.297395  ORF Transcript_125302/g.297395 Transcript_125302/m.297395 type:complete len:260 (-) Transcript_125302:8-787(-)
MSVWVGVMVPGSNSMTIAAVDEAVEDGGGHQGGELLTVHLIALRQGVGLRKGLDGRSDEEVPAQLHHVGCPCILAKVVHTQRRLLEQRNHFLLGPAGATDWKGRLASAHAIGARKDRSRNEAHAARKVLLRQGPRDVRGHRGAGDVDGARLQRRQQLRGHTPQDLVVRQGREDHRAFGHLREARHGTRPQLLGSVASGGVWVVDHQALTRLQQVCDHSVADLPEPNESQATVAPHALWKTHAAEGTHHWRNKASLKIQL